MKKAEKQKTRGTVKIILTAIMILTVSAIMLSCKNRSDAPPPPPPPPPPSASASANERVFDTVDAMPEYPGGNEALKTYIANNIKYPEEAKENKTEGRVVISFVVEKDGSVDNVEVVKGVEPQIDEEALRVVRSLPKFEKPGIKDGENVAVRFQVPISFKLDSK